MVIRAATASVDGRNPARWGDTQSSATRTDGRTYTLRDWRAMRDRLFETYFPRRSEIVLNQFIQAGLYPSVAAPSFNQHGGAIANGFQLVVQAPGPVYVTLDGSDPRRSSLEPGATEATLPFSIICVEKKDEVAWFLGCECTLECVQFSTPQLIEETPLDDETVRREYRVVGSIANPEAQAERVSGMVTLSVASPSMRPLKTFPIRLTNEPPVYCTPAALVVRSPPRSCKVVVRADDEVRFRIRSAAADEALVSVEFDPEPERDTHVLKVNVEAASNNEKSSRIVLTTSHPRCETVELSVVLESRMFESSGGGTN